MRIELRMNFWRPCDIPFLLTNVHISLLHLVKSKGTQSLDGLHAVAEGKPREVVHSGLADDRAELTRHRLPQCIGPFNLNGC